MRRSTKCPQSPDEPRWQLAMELARLPIVDSIVAQKLGVTRGNFAQWLRKGREDDEHHAPFAWAFLELRADVCIRLSQQVIAGGKGSSNAQWLLEKLWPRDYARTYQRLEHTGANGKPLEIGADAESRQARLTVLLARYYGTTDASGGAGAGSALARTGDR